MIYAKDGKNYDTDRGDPWPGMDVINDPVTRQCKKIIEKAEGMK